MALSSINRRYLLLCEGMHDAQFFENLAEDRGFPGKFQIASCGYVGGSPPGRDGITHLTNALNALPGLPNFHRLEAVLITADNDSDPKQAFANVLDLIGKTADIVPGRRYVVPPSELTKVGLNPALAVMMVPWKGMVGALDTLCHQSAATRRPAIAAEVAAFANRVGVDAVHGWPITKAHKMMLRSLLSAAHMDDPYISPAWVWKDGTDLVPIGDTAFDQIAKFLRDFPTATP